MISCLVDWLFVCLVGNVDLLMCWLIDWLVRCLVVLLIDRLLCLILLECWLISGLVDWLTG